MNSPLALVATGAPLTARLSDVAEQLRRAGWDVTVMTTTAARPWVDEAAVIDATGRPSRDSQRSPDEPKPPRPVAVVICPATFNTLNKLAVGIADTYPMSLLCESLGAGIPMIAVPMVNNLLWGHPVWATTFSSLEAAGVRMLDPHTGEAGAQPVASGTGQQVVDAFDPAWICAALHDSQPR